MNNPIQVPEQAFRNLYCDKNVGPGAPAASGVLFRESVFGSDK